MNASARALLTQWQASGSIPIRGKPPESPLAAGPFARRSTGNWPDDAGWAFSNRAHSRRPILILPFFTRPRRQPPARPSTDGRLVYAVGDIHGRLDLLQPLLEDIERDARAAGNVHAPVVIFLGDYVDRGPASRGVVDRLLTLRAQGSFDVRFLKGNHEDALLRFLDAPETGPRWIEFGAGATLISYGVTPPIGLGDPPGWTRTRDDLIRAMPAGHTDFYRSLELCVTLGDYGFVHAGVRPGVALDQQTEQDLLYIRREFLDWDGAFEKVIVHGHTPAKTPQLTPFRLGIDTGAYATGVLTAIRLEDCSQRILHAVVPASPAR